MLSNGDSSTSSPIFTFNNPNSPVTLQHSQQPQGVSSLSTLFGEPKYKAISNPYNFNPAQSATTVTGTTTATTPLSPIHQPHSPNVQNSPNIVINNQQNTNSPIHHIVTPSTNSHSPISSPLVTSSSNNTSAINSSPSINSNNNNNSTGAAITPSTNESNEKDTIIANDIETDKLLNVIERSKGFSDFNSTTRRLRNRNNPFSVAFSNSANLNNNLVNNNLSLDENDLNNLNSNKKINKLIWNEERLELEFRNKEKEREEEEAAAAAAAAAADGACVNLTNGKQSPSLQIPASDRQSIYVSPNSSLKRQKSANGLEVCIIHLIFSSIFHRGFTFLCEVKPQYSRFYCILVDWLAELLKLWSPMNYALSLEIKFSIKTYSYILDSYIFKQIKI